MKKIATVLLAFAGGAAIGLLFACMGIVLFTDIPLGEFAHKLADIDVGELLVPMLMALLALFVSVPLLFTVHEAGHLAAGLMSGYSFVSFRIFNFVIIREHGRLRVKRFSIAGTGGQCLLSPPDLPIDMIPTAFYNIGGVLANLFCLVIVLPVAFADIPYQLRIFVIIFCGIDVLLILMNGIPMKVNGVGNDGYNALHLNGSLAAKQGMICQLRANALIQNGVRPKDMPDEWFAVPERIDYRNPLEVSLPLAAASRMVDMEQWGNAYKTFRVIYAHKEGIGRLFTSETECELLFLSAVTGRLDEARRYFTPELEKYIRSYAKVMSSKVRVLFAVKLYLNGNPVAARALYDDLESRRASYLLQGEVASDLAIMRGLLDKHQ